MRPTSRTPSPRRPAARSPQPAKRAYKIIAQPAASAGPISRPTRATQAAIATAPGPVDYPLVVILAVLLALGLVMVYSASFNLHGARFFLRQVAWVAVGIVILIVMSRIPYRFWQRTAIPIMGIALALLVAVLFFGEERYGARRTFSGSIQPSEFAKLAVVIYVSAWVSSRGRRLAEIRGGLIPFAILMGTVTSLIVLEPSFSMAIIILIIGVAIFFVGGADIKQLLIVGVIGAAILGLLLWQSAHAMQRIEAWWQVLTDPANAPENMLRAVEVQRMGGSGLGPNPQVWDEKSLVPLLWSDYLFANIGADLGFVGQMAVVVLFAVLGYRALGIALNAEDQFGGLVAIGVTTWILVQAATHIGTSLALTPPTGQPLPFMSYGGSAMLSSLAAMGLLLNISRFSNKRQTAHEDGVVRWWHRGARVSDPRRGERATDRRPKLDNSRQAEERSTRPKHPGGAR